MHSARKVLALSRLEALVSRPPPIGSLPRRKNDLEARGAAQMCPNLTDFARVHRMELGQRILDAVTWGA